MVLLFVAGTGLGVFAAHRLHKRAMALGCLERLSAYWADRIRATAAPLSVLATEAAVTAEFRSLPFWQGDSYTRSALCEAARHGAAALALNEEDKRLLVDFIDGFGGGDVSGEAERCRRYAVQFHARFEAAAEEARRRGRSHITLGLCAGGMAALLLGG